MNQRNLLIQTKDRAICLVLDAAIGLLAEMDFKNEVSNAVRDDCSTDIFNIIVQVATISCGKDTWSEVYDFLISIGIRVSSDLNLKMMYMESISEVKPSDERHFRFYTSRNQVLEHTTSMLPPASASF